MGRGGAKMGLVRLVPAKEVVGGKTLSDRLPQQRRRNQPPRLGVQPRRVDPGLVGVNHSAPGKVIFGGDRSAVQFQPVKLEVALGEHGRHDFAMKRGKTRRGKTTALAKRAATPLVQVDQHSGGPGQVLDALDRVQDRAARAEQLPLQAANLLSMALGQAGKILFPTPRKLDAPTAWHGAAVSRSPAPPGGRPVRRQAGPRRRRRRVGACPTPAAAGSFVWVWREKIGQSLDHRGFNVGPAEDADVIGTDFARAQRANDAAAGAGVFKEPRGRPDKEIDVIEHAQNEQPGPRGFIMSPPGGKPRPTAQRRAGCQPIPSIGARL